MKILVVDDEDFICELLDEFLSMHGHQVTVATNGARALDIYQRFQPEMVLLDIRMPDTSGLDLLVKLKSQSRSVSVIMLSAYGDSETVQAANEMGACSYMQKPIDLKRLLAAIEQDQHNRGWGPDDCTATG